jgi:uncharacterized membrane protein
MAQWYCIVDGQRYGPGTEQEVRAWMAEGRVKPTDYVWAEGMPTWAPAAQIFGPGGPGETLLPPSPLPPSVSMVSVPAPGGTGGQTPNDQLTAQAREALRGRWGPAVVFCLLLGLLNLAMSLVSQVVPVGLVLGGSFAVGACIFFLTFTRGGPTANNMLFAGFNNFGNALGAYILSSIFIFLWMLLLIVPGILAALSYSQTFYLLADDKTLGPLEALRKSKAMMEGHKGRLFCLGLRFLGWSLLCILSLGIGYLWLMPYMYTTYARFYDDLQPPRAG